MKKQDDSLEAELQIFIKNHNNGDFIGKLMKEDLSKKEVQFLKNLTAGRSYQKKKDEKTILDLVNNIREVPLSEIISALRRYIKEGISSGQSFEVNTVDICFEALKNHVSRHNQNRLHVLPFMGLKYHTDLKNLTGIMKELIASNTFDSTSFKKKFIQMKTIPLEIIWCFHSSDIISFTNYIFRIADKDEEIEHLISRMVELLCIITVGPAYCSLDRTGFGMESENMAADIRENFEKHYRQQDEAEIKLDDLGNGEQSEMQVKKQMATDLLLSLLCVTQETTFELEAVKLVARKCEFIAENSINMAVNDILSTLLSSSSNDNYTCNYLLPLLRAPTLSSDILQSFLNSHLVKILSYKPSEDSYGAIAKQQEWTYSKTVPALTYLIETILNGMEETWIIVLKDIIQNGEVNWKLALISISTYLKCVSESEKVIKNLVDWLLNKSFLDKDYKLLTAMFLIVRQCCLENCSPLFPSYLTWFSTTFGQESPWASRSTAPQQKFNFLIQFLTDIVPYEPASFLKVHINKAPVCPPAILMDYISLAKTRLKDLNEAPGFGLFRPELTTEEDIDCALKYFETHNGEIAQTLLDASLFRRQHFEQEFLGKLLTPRVIPEFPDTKARFIEKLHSIGKISNGIFNKYQEACLARKK